MSIDVSQFLGLFFEESFEGLQAMEAGLLEMRNGSVDQETINAIFRAAHSIKGGSGTFGLHEVGAFTHLLETLLEQIRSGDREISADLRELFLQSVDCLRELLRAKQQGGNVDNEWIQRVQLELENALNDSALPTTPEVKPVSETQSKNIKQWAINFAPSREIFSTANDPLRIIRELGRLGSLEVMADTSRVSELSAFDAEECMMSWKINLQSSASKKEIEEAFDWVKEESSIDIELVSESDSSSVEISVESKSEKQVVSSVNKAKTNQDGGSIRVNIEKIDALINIVGELVITQSMLGQLGEDFNINAIESLKAGLIQLSRNTRELQESVLSIRMLPISFAFNRFPRLVHDISQKLGKKVELKMIGEQTEVDKTVLELIGDPLLHLVRNAIDHGIEMPEKRLASGKSETGELVLNAYHHSGNIVIEVSDNGAGINKEKLVKKALSVGVIKDDKDLSEDEILELIFHPGLSTVDAVSDLSGRGVGMDVVRNNIRHLNGSVDVSSEPGKGTRFTIRLPLTLAILDGQTVTVGDESYIIPLVSIVESVQARTDMLNLVAGKGETFKLRNEYLPIIRLHEVFGIDSVRSKNLTDGILVVVEGDGRRCGLFVDELAGQQQVVIKSLEDNYQRVEGVSGATIIGDGSVALILDLPGLVRLNNLHIQNDQRLSRHVA